MFRTVLVHLQEQLYKLYIVFGICRYLTCGCRMAIATQQPHVSAYTKCDVQLIKVAPDDGLTESETCRASNGK